MRIFGKSAAQKRIDNLVEANADLYIALVKERERNERLASKWAAGQVEIDTLRAQLQPFLDRQEKAKANLRQYRAPKVMEAAREAV